LLYSLRHTMPTRRSFFRWKSDCREWTLELE
jgi:hypothetical protein